MEFAIIAFECPYEPEHHHIMAHRLGVEDFEVKIAATRNLEAEIRDAFLAHFRYVPERLRFTPVDSIPPGPNGKFYASICTV